LGVRNFAERFDYRLAEYYPFDQYISAIQDTDTKFIDFHAI